MELKESVSDELIYGILEMRLNMVRRSLWKRN